VTTSGSTHSAASGVEDLDAGGVVHELEQISVAGDDIDLLPPTGPVGQGADDVVGLVAVAADAGNSQGPQRIRDQRHLWREVLGLSSWTRLPSLSR
jgi:hypothetical protein